jgi:hypothetical protein
VLANTDILDAPSISAHVEFPNAQIAINATATYRKDAVETPLHDLAGVRRETDARINDHRNIWRTLTQFT